MMKMASWRDTEETGRVGERKILRAGTKLNIFIHIIS